MSVMRPSWVCYHFEEAVHFCASSDISLVGVRWVECFAPIEVSVLPTTMSTTDGVFPS